MVDITNASQIANLYSNNQNLGTKAAGSGSEVSAGAPNFADFLESGVQSAINTQKAAETMSAKAVTGEADLTDVVTAITNAEVTLETVVAVRDRLVSAVQEILRMPI